MAGIDEQRQGPGNNPAGDYAKHEKLGEHRRPGDAPFINLMVSMPVCHDLQNYSGRPVKLKHFGAP